MESIDAPKDWEQSYPLAMRWYNKPGILQFDMLPEDKQPVGWYRFTSSPGLRGMTITARGKVQTWADGKEMSVKLVERDVNGSQVYIATSQQPQPDPVVVAMRIEQERGCYGGAALPEPILLDCVPGSIEPGDWSEIDGLASYSGGAWYRITVELSSEQANGRIMLNLGLVVSTAEIHVNGQLAGIKVAPPWKVDISKLVRQGKNRIEVLVYNTLANHYLTIPTRYRGSLMSGLIGPVSIMGM
jgi:hypothetical protein